MRTVILGPRPPEIEALIQSRRATGADRHDEVWEGDYHMNPLPRGRHAFLQFHLIELFGPLARGAGLAATPGVNIGTADDYRGPDLALLREYHDLVYFPSAALVAEILSPYDESWEKLPFYAAHDVEEVVIVDPVERSVEWLRIDAESYARTEHSDVLDMAVAQIVAEIVWPPVADD